VTDLVGIDLSASAVASAAASITSKDRIAIAPEKQKNENYVFHAPILARARPPVKPVIQAGSW
jgi:hypothetical protein